MISYLTEPFVEGLINDSAYLWNDNDFVGKVTTTDNISFESFHPRMAEYFINFYFSISKICRILHRFDLVNSCPVQYSFTTNAVSGSGPVIQLTR